MTNRVVAVTGATGHLGANLVRMLVAAGDHVRAVTSEPVSQDLAALRGIPVERVQADVTDVDAVKRAFEGVDTVYHLAGWISVAKRDTARMWRVNHDGARIVAEACVADGVRRLVHVSSVQTLAPGEVLDETSRLATDDAPAYDLSKLAGERAVLDAVEDGLDAVIALPTAIVGPHDHGPSRAGRSLLKIWAGGLPAVTEGGHDWVDVRDVAQGLIAAERFGRTGARYLLGGGWASLWDLARTAAALAGQPGPRVVVATGLARAAAPVAELAARVTGSEPWFTPAALHALHHHKHVDHSLAASELAYGPRPLAETLADTHTWWRGREYSRVPAALPTALISLSR
jgi:dihydroflavonol-4-reductase